MVYSILEYIFVNFHLSLMVCFVFLSIMEWNEKFQYITHFDICKFYYMIQICWDDCWFDTFFFCRKKIKQLTPRVSRHESCPNNKTYDYASKSLIFYEYPNFSKYWYAINQKLTYTWQDLKMVILRLKKCYRSQVVPILCLYANIVLLISIVIIAF